VLLRHAYATCPLCVPARVSLMTGRYPHATGSRTNAFYYGPGRYQDVITELRAALLDWTIESEGSLPPAAAGKDFVDGYP